MHLFSELVNLNNSSSHHEGDREVVQSGGRMVVRQVGVQVP